MIYRTEKNGSTITLWDDAQGIGLQFTGGEPFAGLNASLVVKNPETLQTEEGVKNLSEVSNALHAYAQTHFPEEFKPIK